MLKSDYGLLFLCACALKFVIYSWIADPADIDHDLDSDYRAFLYFAKHTLIYIFRFSYVSDGLASEAVDIVNIYEQYLGALRRT
jgi:hypothetical protein